MLKPPLPPSPLRGFSIDNIDKTIDPCVDFYQYACGNWLKNSEIPADQSQWVSFVELHERNLDIERDILEKASAGGASRNPIDQKIGDLYGSCMDEKAVNAKGITPLKPELDRVAAAKDKSALIDELAHLHLISSASLFSFYSSPDLHNADQVIAYIDQGGLTLPDRDYYIKDDNPKMKEMRQHLVEYVTQVFTLVGSNAAAGSRFSADRSAHRDRSGQSFDGPHGAARSEESRSQNESRRGGGPRSEFLSEPLLRWSGRAKFYAAQCYQSRFLQAGEWRDLSRNRWIR